MFTFLNLSQELRLVNSYNSQPQHQLLGFTTGNIPTRGLNVVGGDGNHKGSLQRRVCKLQGNRDVGSFQSSRETGQAMNI